MCGIIGIINKEAKYANKEVSSIFRTLLVVDSLRGEDSTGIFAVPNEVRKDQAIFIDKKATNAIDFLNTARITEFYTEVNEYKFVVGHNRYATKGAISNANAHPFYHNSITLVHNGTINSFGKYIRTSNKDFSVDSENLTYLFSKNDPIDVLEEIYGSYALVWHNNEDDSLNIIRNDERPLVWTSTPFGFIFASEAWMLAGALSRVKIKFDKINEIPEHSHVHILCDNNKIKVKTTDHSKRLDNTSGGKYAVYYGRGRDNFSGKYVRPEEIEGRKVGDTLSLIKKSFNSYVSNTNGHALGTLIAIATGKNNKIFDCKIYSFPEELFNLEKEYPTAKIHYKATLDNIFTGTDGKLDCTMKDFTAYLEFPDKSIIKITPKKYIDIKPGSPPYIEEYISHKKDNILCLPEPNSIKYSGKRSYFLENADGQRTLITKREWRKVSKDGCCNCSTNLEPLIIEINDSGNNILENGNCIVDENDNLWCDTCYIDTHMLN